MSSHERELAVWQQVLEPANRELINTAQQVDTARVQDVATLRKHWPADLVRCALELIEARRRAAHKFPTAHNLVADVAGVEQATDHVVATHKARRFQNVSDRSVLDLCCGIGGDAMALQQVCCVTAIDHAPLRTWMTHHNAGCDVQTCDVREVDIAGRHVHCDPARRDEVLARRTWKLEDYQPGPAFLAHVMSHAAGGCLKLGPGLDRDALDIDAKTEFEYISHRGRLVQLAVWFGDLASSGLLRATLLPDGITISAHGASPPPQAEHAGSHLAVADPAVERAGLLDQLCRQHALAELAPGLGILTGDEYHDTAALRFFRICEVLPWREAKVKDALQALDAGPVEIKTRGGAVDPDPLHKRLRGKGAMPYTVFILRLGDVVRAFITQRVEGTDDTSC